MGTSNQQERPDESNRLPSRTEAKTDVLVYTIVLAVFGAIVGVLLAWGLDASIGWRISSAIAGALLLGAPWLIKPYRSFWSQPYRAFRWATEDPTAPESIGKAVGGGLKRQKGYMVLWLLSGAIFGALLGALVGSTVGGIGSILGAALGALAGATLELILLAGVTALDIAIVRTFGLPIGYACLGGLVGAILGMELWERWGGVDWPNTGALVVGIPMAILFAVLGWRRSRKRGP